MRSKCNFIYKTNRCFIDQFQQHKLNKCIYNWKFICVHLFCGHSHLNCIYLFLFRSPFVSSRWGDAIEIHFFRERERKRERKMTIDCRVVNIHPIRHRLRCHSPCTYVPTISVPKSYVQMPAKHFYLILQRFACHNRWWSLVCVCVYTAHGRFIDLMIRYLWSIMTMLSCVPKVYQIFFSLDRMALGETHKTRIHSLTQDATTSLLQFTTDCWMEDATCNSRTKRDQMIRTFLPSVAAAVAAAAMHRLMMFAMQLLCFRPNHRFRVKRQRPKTATVTSTADYDDDHVECTIQKRK